MNWNLADHLLINIKQIFNKVIATYINVIWSRMKIEFGNPKTPVVQRVSDSQSQPTQTPIGNNESIENFVKELISKEMPVELFR